VYEYVLIKTTPRSVQSFGVSKVKHRGAYIARCSITVLSFELEEMRYVSCIMESRQAIIDELRRLGVNVNQILILRPTDEQLKAVRDGLTRLRRD